MARLVVEEAELENVFFEEMSTDGDSDFPKMKLFLPKTYLRYLLFVCVFVG